MPQRFLKPGITTSDNWNACSFEAQSLYIRLLTLVDDWGRYDARVPVLHGHCFALRNDIKPQRTAALRSELHANGLIRVYEVEGKEFLQFEKWTERARGERSKFPDPPMRSELPQESAGIRSGPQALDASLATTSSPLHPRSSSIAIASTPLRWSEAGGWEGVSEELISELKPAFPACNIERQFLAMGQWLKANPAKAKKSNWRRFVDNWLRRQQDRGGDITRNGSNGHSPPSRESVWSLEKRIEAAKQTIGALQRDPRNRVDDPTKEHPPLKPEVAQEIGKLKGQIEQWKSCLVTAA